MIEARFNHKLQPTFCRLWFQYQFNFQSLLWCYSNVSYTPVWKLGGGLPHCSVLKIFHILFSIRLMHAHFGSDPRGLQSYRITLRRPLLSTITLKLPSSLGPLLLAPSQKSGALASQLFYALLMTASVCGIRQWGQREKTATGICSSSCVHRSFNREKVFFPSGF